MRGLGLPAAYVSGYIRTVPAAGKERLEGADASHAWVSLWCGPEEGWIGFDPTNDMEVANEHVVLAIGRDYDDISPIHGILLGPGEQEIDVGVDVVPWTGALLSATAALTSKDLARIFGATCWLALTGSQARRRRMRCEPIEERCRGGSNELAKARSPDRRGRNRGL